MAFTKGNKLASVTKGKPKPKTEQWQAIVGWLAGNGGVEFKKKLEALSVGVEITKEEDKFMQYFMDLLEYHQPKLSRREQTGEINIKLSKIEYLENQIRAISGMGNRPAGGVEDEAVSGKSVQG